MNDKQPILLVDDSENDLYLMRLAFQKAELDNPLYEARNGEAAIAYLNGDFPYADRSVYPLPVVMLLDLNMPLKDGFDVLTWANARPRFKRLSILVLSASRRPEDVERAFDLGATSFLVKPGTMEELTDMIRSLGRWLRYNQFPSIDEAAQR